MMVETRSWRIVEELNLELARKAIRYVNKNIKAGSFPLIERRDVIPEETALEWVRRYEAGEQLVAVALEGDDVIGLAHLDIRRGRGCDVAYLNVTVDAGHRRKGIGTALVRSLIEQAARRSIRRIIGKPRKENTAAIRLLQKLGFKIVKEVEREGKVFVVMVRGLGGEG